MKITKRAAAVVTAASMAMALAVPGAALAQGQANDRGGEGRGADAREARADNNAHGQATAEQARDRRQDAGQQQADGQPRARTTPPDNGRTEEAPSASSRGQANQARGQSRADGTEGRDNERRGGGVTHRPPHTDEEIHELEGNDERGPWNRRVTLCHATASETNPYVMITVSHRAVVKGGHGNHDDDIIPPFDYLPHRGGEVETYAGLNWNAETEAIFEAGCVVAGVAAGGEEVGQDVTPGDGVAVSDRVLGVTVDADEDAREDADVEGDDVLGVVEDAEDADDEQFGVGGGDEADDQAVADTIAGVSADADAETAVQAAQANDFAGGVLARTGLPLAALLIAGLLSLLTGAGLLRRRS